MSKKICLDPGHYGKYNQSTEVSTYYESEVMWSFHLYLKADLEALGFEVITTRSDPDQDLALYTRGTTAQGCDCFISLHSNACGTESVDYPVVFRAYDNLNDADTIALKLATEIGTLMGTAQAGRTATRVSSSGGEYYGVIRGARAVNVPLYLLIEHSFHTNKAATLWLLEDENLKKLSKLEAQILADYYGMSPQEDTSTYCNILGSAQCSAQQMYAYLKGVNPQATEYFSLAQTYLEEGEAEGVRGDVAFAQTLLETGHFQFGGDVLPAQNNFCGLGTTGNGEPGCSFDTPTLGVRAQIQHLQAYAGTGTLHQACVDPRYGYVTRGSAPYVEWLGSQENPQGLGWASASGYGAKILALLEKIKETEGETMPEVIPDWMKPATDWMVEQQLMVGDGDGNLQVNDPVTRGQLAVILYAYHQKFGQTS